MRENSSFRQGQRKAEERKKLLKIAAIPFAVIVLILVIVLADRGKNEFRQADVQPQTAAERLAEKETETMPEQETEAVLEEVDAQSEELEPEEADTQPEAPILKKDAVPEILALMKDYYQARAAGDAELLNKLYGIDGLSVTQLEAEKTRMRSNSKYLRSFDNIVTYTADGLSENEWLVYSACDMHFHSVDTTAPMIMWCYVVKQEDGSFLIQKQEDLSADVQHYVDVVSRSQEVRSLASDINVRLKDALTSDTELNAIYGVLRDGSPVYEDDESQERTAVQILDETQPEETAEASESEMTESEETQIQETAAEMETESESVEEAETQNGEQ